ncbi:hypothetical protein SMU29_03752 [Streptococcus mutans 2ST1]|nr:hypothetical protein SMU29_03752 [Streptococcus mutans 2ST1]
MVRNRSPTKKPARQLTIKRTVLLYHMMKVEELLWQWKKKQFI